MTVYCHQERRRATWTETINALMIISRLRLLLRKSKTLTLGFSPRTCGSGEAGISTQSIYNIIGNSVDIDDLKYRTIRMIAQTLNVEIEDLRS